MAPHSSTLAWKMPWMEEPSGLQSYLEAQLGEDLTSCSLASCWQTSASHWLLAEDFSGFLAMGLFGLSDNITASGFPQGK